ncbi:hypothetical protein CAPTEDRAFT_208971 [Capitella teleta]|uniref:Uncharacterized protein n=1 Tax=Capitella teleta TaxID=283909 RepID=R7V784_CAPTE|nr:hypothetical protein CAPTEDRAFT_208971 [Capitella teleta]|eukprot:ELU11625.1 hypothetical protein CAPTEDRAFT_208971 [Capitella teleta]
MKIASVVGDTPADHRRVRNERLCYAFTHVSNATQHNLINCFVEFYSPLEVANARELLLKEVDQILAQLNGKKALRHQLPCDNFSARPYAENIVQWIVMVLNNDLNMNSMAEFYAIDLRKQLRKTAIRTKRPEPSDATPRIEVSQKPPQSSVWSLNKDETTSKIIPETASVATGIIPDTNKWTEVVKKKRVAMKNRKKVRAIAKGMPKVVGTASASGFL